MYIISIRQKCYNFAKYLYNPDFESKISHNKSVTEIWRLLKCKERKNMSVFLMVIGTTLLAAGICLIFIIKNRRTLKAALITSGIALFLLGNSLVIIPTGYTGVKSTLGQIDEKPLSNGASWKIPFIQTIEKVNNKQQNILFNGQTWSETKERTALYYEDILITYQINPEKSAWIYANVTNYKDSLLPANLVVSAVKASSKELNTTDATNRGIIEPIVQENIQKALNEKYGGEVVIINKVSISNTDFEESYNNAIADKQAAQLTYEKQQIENKQKIEAAEADAQVQKTKAQAEAEAEVIKAQGEADANKILSESITQNTLKQQYFDKWDGKLPSVIASDSENGLMLGVGNITEIE